MIKTMKEKGTTTVNPIYHWTSEDIWDYARKENIEMNPLYSCGYDRVGCIGCPLAAHRQRMKEFNDYPKYKQLYLHAFEKMLEIRRKRNLPFQFDDAEEVFDWWVEEYKYNVKGQISIDEWLKGES